MPYNDATLDYIERSIEDERDKLEQLVQYRKQYEQEVKILNDQMAKGENSKLLEQPEVETLTQKLYSLKHYGKVLQGMGKVLDTVQRPEQREKQYVMRAKPPFLVFFCTPDVDPQTWGSGRAALWDKTCHQSAATRITNYLKLE